MRVKNADGTRRSGVCRGVDRIARYVLSNILECAGQEEQPRTAASSMPSTWPKLRRSWGPPSQFMARFARASRIPPHRRPINLRLHFAEKLLGDGEFAIAQLPYLAVFSAKGFLAAT